MAEPLQPAIDARIWGRSADPRIRRAPLAERPELLAWLGAAAAGRCTPRRQRDLLLALSDLAWTPELSPLLEGWVGVGLPRRLVSDLRRVAIASPGTACGGERVYDEHPDGVIDLCFDPDWSPATDEASRQETLAFVWPRYWSDMESTLDVGLDFAALAGCVREWAISDAPGSFWDDGSGPAGKVVLHALRLVATYVENIGEDAPQCPGARSAMTANLFRTGWIDVDRYGPLGDDRSVLETRHGLPRFFDGARTEVTGQTNTWTGQVHLGAQYVEQLGQAVDLLLWQAHRAAHAAWTGRAPGSIVGAVYYLQQARWLGGMALGGIATIANTLVHETMHAEVTGNHCQPDNNCCQERVAANWQCRTMAQTGALACPYTEREDGSDVVDLRITGWVASGSLCRDKASFEDACASEVSGARGRFFCWSAVLDDPGAPSSSEAWARDGAWVSPAGCT